MLSGYLRAMLSRTVDVVAAGKMGGGGGDKKDKCDGSNKKNGSGMRRYGIWEAAA